MYFWTPCSILIFDEKRRIIAAATMLPNIPSVIVVIVVVFAFFVLVLVIVMEGQLGGSTGIHLIDVFARS